MDVDVCRAFMFMETQLDNVALAERDAILVLHTRRMMHGAAGHV